MSQDILGPLMRVLVDVPQDRLPLIRDFSHKLAGIEGEEWVKQSNLFLRKKPNWSSDMVVPDAVKKETVQPTSILRLISGGTSLAIPACTGQRTIARAKQIFTGYLDPDFKNWKTDQPGQATPDTAVLVHEMVQDATFAQMFGELASAGDINKLVLTQDQIITFVEVHPSWLRSDGWATFFLFEENNELFVARVVVYSDGRRKACVNRFEYSCVWYGEYRLRLVTPQLLAA